MPIHFYCVECNKLLGIGTRKAGQVVNCPSCKTRLRVPTPEQPGQPAASAATIADMPSPPGSVFERSDFEEVLKDEPAVPVQIEVTIEEASGLPVAPAVGPRRPSDSMTAPRRRRQSNTGMVILILVLIGLAFAGGFVVGRFTAG